MDQKEVRTLLSQYRVGIAGAGGLGSNCAVALARTGVGTLVICDYDAVEESNLNRQYYFTNQIGRLKTDALKMNISAIDQRVNVIAHAVRLDPINIPQIFAGCDVIVEAFDSAEMKEMLIETVQTVLQGIPLIAGSGLAGWGKSNLIRFREIDENLIVCGDEISQSGELPLLAPRVAMVANMQANAVIEILMKKADENNAQ